MNIDEEVSFNGGWLRSSHTVRMLAMHGYALGCEVQKGGHPVYKIFRKAPDYPRHGYKCIGEFTCVEDLRAMVKLLMSTMELLEG